ncbi:MAG: hypothetical protein JW807_06480 [Spirochaetes bacterium]|nr:hypothetical protein [Spirochaetota bacterium]
MKVIHCLFITALSFSISCSAPDIARLIKNVNLERKGIHLRIDYVPRGLYKKPFIIKFDNMLYNISLGTVIVKAYNVYTVGNYDKLSPDSIENVSNFLDPTCKFKDTWFGVYIIIDDDLSMGRRFILKNPHGNPDDLENLNDDALIMLPKLDQKIIVWSTRQNQKDYHRQKYEHDFYFTPRKGTALSAEIVYDTQGRAWRKLFGEFDTIAAVTDVRKTNMSLFTSIRNYVGLPNERVYDAVRPWHPVIIKGCVLARYFRCSELSFWAVAYYNGSAFTTVGGREVDNWENTDLRKELEQMFDRLAVDCAQK